MEDDKLKEKVEEMKIKAKAFMKNFSSPFAFGSSRSSQTFKGQGHRLGGSAEPSSHNSSSPVTSSGGRTVPATGEPNVHYGGKCGAARKLGPGFNQQQQQSDLRLLQQKKWERERGVDPAQSSVHHHDAVSSSHPLRTHSHQFHVVQSVDTRASAAASVKSSTPDESLIGVERESRGTVRVGNLAPSYTTLSPSLNDSPSRFDPYSSIIASGTSHRPSVAALRDTALEERKEVQCPICQKWWQSEEQVSAHIDDCTGVVGSSELAALAIQHSEADGGDCRKWEQTGSLVEDLDEAVAMFLSGGPSSATIGIILRVFGDILKDPTNEKCRKLRLGNLKIKETIGSAIGGWDFMAGFGFRLITEGTETFCLMGQPKMEQLNRMQKAVSYLEPYFSTKATPASDSPTSQPRSATPSPPIVSNVNKINRQMRIFYAPNDRMEERFELPDSFYSLTAAEAKTEAAARRKKREDSQLLIPKTFKEKQAATARQRYKATVVRVQLPDGLVIQGFFKPGEPTSTVYEFVASTLKDGGLTFDLVLPAATRHPVIPASPGPNGRWLTLEEVELVPTALLKFKPTGPQGYTCLKSECYALCEPLTLTTPLVGDDFLKN